MVHPSKSNLTEFDQSWRNVVLPNEIRYNPDEIFHWDCPISSRENFSPSLLITRCVGIKGLNGRVWDPWPVLEPVKSDSYPDPLRTTKPKHSSILWCGQGIPWPTKRGMCRGFWLIAQRTNRREGITLSQPSTWLSESLGQPSAQPRLTSMWRPPCYIYSRSSPSPKASLLFLWFQLGPY